MAITGRAENLETITGVLQRDSKRWPEYVKIGGMFVKYWVWDALERLPEGKKVRIRIEVLDE